MLFQRERPPRWIRRENYLNMAAVTRPSASPEESKASVGLTCCCLSVCTGVSACALLLGVCLSCLSSGRETCSALSELPEPGRVKGDVGRRKGAREKRG